MFLLVLFCVRLHFFYPRPSPNTWSTNSSLSVQFCTWQCLRLMIMNPVVMTNSSRLCSPSSPLLICFFYQPTLQPYIISSPMSHFCDKKSITVNHPLVFEVQRHNLSFISLEQWPRKDPWIIALPSPPANTGQHWLDNYSCPSMDRLINLFCGALQPARLRRNYYYQRS